MINSARSLAKADRQQYLFKSLPKRTELLKIKTEWLCEEILIRVHRNHSFEYIASAIDPFLGFAGYQAEFIYSDYDDSLSLLNCENQTASIEIFWLDYDRYFSDAANKDIDFFVSWLGTRIKALRKISKAPILINSWPSLVSSNQLATEYKQRLIELVKDLPGVNICCQQSILCQLGEKFFDVRSAKLTGTNWSDRACILNARQLACHWIPASLSPRLKAIIVDLDLTLYEGVLGEDGIDGITITEAHLQLQQELLALKKSGVFIAIVSRNDRKDVEELFQKRTDFLIKLEDFAIIEVNWQDKSENILKIADSLRIGLDSILFIDDNPGEIAQVSENIQEVWTLLAAHQILTVDILKFYPRLWTWEKTTVDNLRLADLKSISIRESLAHESQSIGEYWQVLQVELDVHINPVEQLVRLCELSQKTNQFNLNLARIRAAEMSDYLVNPDWVVICIHLRDRLSDSGTICLIVGERVGKNLIIHEICISCRALGRHLEDIMIGYALHQAINLLSTKTITFRHQSAARNHPALNWLAQFTRISISGDQIEITLNNLDIPTIDPVQLSALKINTYNHSRPK